MYKYMCVKKKKKKGGGGTRLEFEIMWFTLLNIVAVAYFLRKSIFGNFRIFVASGQEKRAASIGAIR